MSPRIPRIIHRIWLGDSPMPDQYVRFGESWRRHHPDWELRTWTDGTLPVLRNQAAFDASTVPAQRADLLRYELLHEHGGVYVDCDFECLRPLDGLLEGVEAFAASEDGRHVSIGILGAAARHPFFGALVDEAPASVAAGAGRRVNEVTGPHFFTRLLTAESPGAATVRIFPPELFYPYLYNERDRRDEDFADAYAVHHWGASWDGVRVPVAPRRHRVVVATDWTAPGTVAALLRSFARLFAPHDPVELVLAVPHEPGDADLAQVVSMLAALGLEPAAMAEISIESHAECVESPYDIAVAPEDADAALVEVGAAVDRLHELRAIVDRHGRPALAAALGEAVDLGEPARLSARLATASARPAPAPLPTAVAAPAHSATYLGEGRVLVRTTWGGKVLAASRDLSITPELVADGTYDVPFTNFLVRSLRPGNVAIDVGANIGLFTVLMARLVGPSGRVLAYEASPANADLLRENVAMNYLTEQTEIIERAAAAEVGSLVFHVTSRFAGNGSIFAHDERYLESYLVDESEALEVACEPLDVHLGRFPSIDLVKVDVEGGEESVFAGMDALLATGAVRQVCFEMLRHAMRDDWEPFCERLRRHARSGWSFALLGQDGLPRCVPLEQLLGEGWFSQVLMRRA